MMLTLYRAATEVGAPLIHLFLARRRARGKEDGARFAERFGFAGRPRPADALIWMHAASVGESLSLLPLIERALADRADAQVLLTTGTVTSARLMAERLPRGAFHQYVPVDRALYVRRFLDHWRPHLVIWAESEFWPNLVSEPAARGIPMVLVQGRVSDSSFAGWRRAPGFIRDLLAGFALALAQTEEDARRLRTLGVRDARCLGNLKFAAPPLPADAAELARLEALIGGRRRWLAASTHPGEEEIAAAVHQRLAPAHPGLLTIIVPRHAERGAAIAALLAARGLAVARRSGGETITPATEVYLADTTGELGLFYRLSEIAFVGKSLVAPGGQNALEAARLGCAVVQGPHVANFAEMTRRMAAAGAAIEVADAAALGVAVGRLLDDESERAQRIKAAQRFAGAEAHVLDQVMAAIAPYLAQLPSAAEAGRARA